VAFPRPKFFGDLRQWAEKLVDSLEQLTEVNPFRGLPVYARAVVPKAAQRGLMLMLYDVVGDESLGYSDGTRWRELCDNVKVVTTAINYQMLSNDRFIIANAGITVTLPAVTTKGLRVVKRINAAGNVTIQGLSGNIDGAATLVLVAQFQAARVFSDGSNWWTC